MNANAKLKSVTGTASLVRPCFSPGLLLRDDDLKQGVDYTRDLSRLLFRSLFGCGVVCGLRVVPGVKCGKLVVTVQSGVALDCHGDPIQVPEEKQISIDVDCDEKLPGKLCIAIRRTEKCCAPRSAVCSDDDDESTAVCTRERDGYEIRISPECPNCACGCAAPEDDAPPPPPPPDVLLARANTEKKTKKERNGVRAAADIEGGSGNDVSDDTCWCADPTSDCYKDHYQGICSCVCSDCHGGCDCDCGWVVLALLIDQSTENELLWKADHRVRRFVRPVLMRDPVVWEETHPQQQTP
jgi:hypothetical protein